MAHGRHGRPGSFGRWVGLTGPVPLPLRLACGRRLWQAGAGLNLPGDGGVTAAPITLPTCADLPKCEAACRQGDARDCLLAAGSYGSGNGAPPDERRATELYERACSLGNGAGCNQAGRMYEFAHGVPQDFARAFSLYEESCRLGEMGGCYNVAVLLEKGQRARDRQGRRRAEALYQKVCEAGSSIACEAAARLRR